MQSRNEEISISCEQVTGPALLLAGVQANALWLIPVIVAAVGLGIVIARKL